tara:strand:+ start:8006 stop:10561 length:2556 start_codon:yes stop_codon:yes gene_type:complete
VKYLLKYKVFENRAVDQLITKYKKYGKTIDDSDLEYFKKITKDLPNNLPRLVKWALEGEEPSELTVPYEYYLDLRNKNLKVPDINQFEKSEDLYDALQLIEQQYRSNKIVQELPSNLKRQYKALKDTTEIDRLFRELSKQDTKGQLINKISRYKTLDELSKTMYNFLSSSSDGYRETVLSLQADPFTDVTYFNNNVIVAKINDYKGSCKFGSSSWCIATSASYFSSYTSNGRSQYFIWDYNLKQTDPLSLIGITMNSFGDILSARKLSDQVNAAHDRNDGSLNWGSKSIEDIIRDKKIPLNKIFFDMKGKEEDIFNYLKNDSKSAVRFLKLNNNISLKNRLFKYFVDNLQIQKLAVINIQVLSSKIKNDYFTDETLIQHLDHILEKNPEYLTDLYKSSEINSYGSNAPQIAIILRYYTLALERLDIDKVIDILIENKDGTTIAKKNISNLIVRKITDLDSNDDRFTHLFYWKNKLSFPVAARKMLLDICRYNVSDLNHVNSVEALKIDKKGFEASKHLANVAGQESVLFGIFQHKPRAGDKSEFINNIIAYMSRLDAVQLNKVILNGRFDFIYIGKKIYEIYDLIDTSIKESIITASELFKKCHEEYGDDSKTTQLYIKSELGYKILRDFDIFNDRPHFTHVTFTISTPKQINNHIDSLKEFFNKAYWYRDTIYQLISTGNSILIEDNMDNIKNYTDMILEGYDSTARDMLVSLYKSKKVNFDDFSTILSHIMNCKAVSNMDTPTQNKFLIEHIGAIDGDIQKFKSVLQSVMYNRRRHLIDYKIVKQIYKQIISNFWAARDNSNMVNILKELNKHYKINEEILGYFDHFTSPGSYVTSLLTYFTNIMNLKN